MSELSDKESDKRFYAALWSSAIIAALFHSWNAFYPFSVSDAVKGRVATEYRQEIAVSDELPEMLSSVTTSHDLEAFEQEAMKVRFEQMTGRQID